MNKRQTIVLVGLLAAAALGIGIIVYATSSPSRRTITVNPAAKRTGTIDAQQAKADFDAQVSKYQAAGGLVAGEQMARVADAARAAAGSQKNAAATLVEAIAVLDKFDVPGNRPFFELDVRPGMSADQWKLTNDALDGALAPVLAKLDEASALPACVWDIKYTNPLFRTLLPHLNGVRGLADLAHRSALAAHHAGRDDVALRRIGQILQIAQWTDQQPFVVTHLVALGISQIATETTSEIVPTLTIGDAPGEASVAQVKALMADFLDETWAREGLRAALEAERLGIIDMAQALEAGKITAKEVAKVVSWKPAVVTEITPGEAYLDAMPMMKRVDPMIEAARTSQRLAQFQAMVPASQGPPPSIMAAIMPSLDRAGVSHYTAIARLRLAATALAARLWIADHGGQPPGELGDLVPKYLAAIPLDPLAPTDGATLTYKRAPRPTIVGVSARPQDRMQMPLTGK